MIQPKPIRRKIVKLERYSGGIKPGWSILFVCGHWGNWYGLGEPPEKKAICRLCTIGQQKPIDPAPKQE